MNLKKIDTIIFDMDGTLYQLDGDGNTMKNSTLSKKVISNSLAFVINREKVTRTEAERIINEAQKDEVGISAFLSRRYGITREDYFADVWNIDPEPIIFRHEIPVKIVKMLKGQKKKLILLTAAPGVWRDKVLKYLEVEDCFSILFSGEMFKSKKEIFEKLSLELSADRILSVGDQYVTDIEPAMKFGMKTFEVKDPSDLEKLCLNLK